MQKKISDLNDHGKLELMLHIGVREESIMKGRDSPGLLVLLLLQHLVATENQHLRQPQPDEDKVMRGSEPKDERLESLHKAHG